MKIRSKSLDDLFDVILSLESREDCYAFFEDLCTIKELQDMAQRLEVAKMLYEGCSYMEIAGKIETSTATIGRVSKCLNYGSGGYRAAIQRLKCEGDQE